MSKVEVFFVSSLSIRSPLLLYCWLLGYHVYTLLLLLLLLLLPFYDLYLSIQPLWGSSSWLSPIYLDAFGSFFYPYYKIPFLPHCYYFFSNSLNVLKYNSESHLPLELFLVQSLSKMKLLSLKPALSKTKKLLPNKTREAHQ